MSRLFAYSSHARIRGAVFGLTAALLLTGCQGGPPGGSPSESSSTTTPTSGVLSPGPSATESSGRATPAAAYRPADAKGKAQNVPVPVIPALAKENSKAGLEAFIRYWFQLFSYAYETGETTGVTEHSSRTCVLCEHLVKSINANHTDNRWLVGGSFQTPVVEVLWDPALSSQQGKVQVIQQEIHYFDPGGSESRSATVATNDAAAFFADYRDGSWRTTDVGIIR
ncbi:DUF6318 family protein [Paenarthrobacter sp. RAF54_2]|uniref:DUF6318 family protein n=1 Tax=Paenarthrobacter sp. RAF54_2 TaxID=3233061 RepID=UPI003F9CF180